MLALMAVLSTGWWLVSSDEPVTAQTRPQASELALVEAPALLSRQDVEQKLSSRIATMRDRHASRLDRAKTESRSYDMPPQPAGMAEVPDEVKQLLSPENGGDDALP